MPKRIAVNKIILVRDGHRIIVKPTQMFDFTAAELKEITESSPDALRKAVNEEADIVEIKAPPVTTVVKGEVGNGKGSTKGNVDKGADKQTNNNEDL